MIEARTLCAVFGIDAVRIQRTVSEHDVSGELLGAVRIDAVDSRMSKVAGPANAVMRVIGALGYSGESDLISVG